MTRSTLPRRPVAYADPGSIHYARLAALMCVVVVLSGIGGSKGVMFGPVITDGAFFLFPLAYIVGDVLSEVYGGRAARRVIWLGFAANLVAVACYAMFILLPGFDDDYGIAKQQALETALGPVWQIVLASLLGFLAGQHLNTLVMVVMKRRSAEKGLVARMFSSAGVGEFVDTLVFCTVAAPAIGITTVGQWANYTLFGFLYKILVHYAAIPFVAIGIRWLKRNEPTYQAALAQASDAPASDAQASSSTSEETDERA